MSKGFAIISPDKRYRYQLGRDVQSDGLVFAFFGVNPSTANATEDDATIRKWIGFCKRNGARKFLVGNPFALRATDVRELARAEHPGPIGPDNHHHLTSIIQQADVLVPCWGSETKVPERLRYRFTVLRQLIYDARKPVRIFGLTERGDPKHPLMLGYDTPLVEWPGMPQIPVNMGVFA
jgi:hypothetical protein